MDILHKTVLILSILICAGCVQDSATSVITEEPEPVATVENWQAESSVIKLDQPQAWLNDLDSPVLHQLIEEALSDNLPLKSALARWEAAQARSDIAGAPLKPRVEAGANASRQRVNQRTNNNLSMDVTASWEPDVWGRLENSAQAAINDEQAFAADYRGARLSLAAEVARNFFASIESDLQEKLAQKNADTFKQSQDVIEERYRRGLNSALDVRLARTDVATAENEITRRAREKDAILRRLDILLGRYPAAELKIADQLPDLLTKVPVGLPSQLLIRRPDLIAAEKRLSAAGERLQESQKNRLPSFRLTGSSGLGSSTLGKLLDWDSLIWSLLAGVTQPIFEGGRLDAEQALAEAQHSEAWANYAQSVLVAFREVETALAAEDRYTQQLEQLHLATNEADKASELALSQYQSGLTDIITLLQAQRRAFTSESALLRTQREQLDNRVALYLALGGGFLSEEMDPLSENQIQQ